MKNKVLEILSQYDNVGDACEQFREFCLVNNISENLSIKLEICLTEALNNVIKHSYEGKPNNKIILTLNLNENKLEIEISETGKPREKIEKPKLEFDPTDIENLPEGGMGLYIIEEIMDETKYHSDGKTNVFTMIKNI